MFAARSLRTLQPAARAFSSTAAPADVAKMILVGRIGATPVVGTTKNDKPYLSYKIATTDPYIPGKDGQEAPAPTTSWHTVFAYGPAVERLQTLEKGTLVVAEAQFRILNEKTESGEYKTAILARHEKISVLKRPSKTEE